ncbi:DUF6849 domain-containing protein [Thermococcus thioreducens]|uniref:ATPase n=1 Tax=Thermococcus thioreducens TaxID=277988 RepID=A0A0Q2REB0_9EURY|nr:ATPase [Thermococcus thioreducens]ASJ12852.1 ATPase [Thermococcus thioreducens]KQH82318.1 ATPase [Thermococcus thioreducens]SEV84305.1 Cell division protein 48 (CDC48), domain 2 [Thermococcus thioreducens]
MKLVLKPLFEAELPADFEELIRSKLMGMEVRTGEEIEVDLLGKPLRFKVLLAEPSPLKVRGNTRIEFSTGSMEVIDLEFDEPVKDVVPFEKGFVILLERKVLILNHNGQKIYSGEFDDLKGVRASKGTVVIIHGRSKIRLVKP